MKVLISEYDEILETIWVKKEDAALKQEQGVLLTHNEATPNQLHEMVVSGLLVGIQDSINFTDTGEQRAREIIRSHRLAERLFVDILDLGENYVEENACIFEHMLSAEILDAICTLLGHPRQCPHGKAIPPGGCCKQDAREVASIVKSLDTLKYGEAGKILYIPSKHHARIDMLSALGIVPGSTLRVHQTQPAYIIKLDETEIALEKEVARDIYVRLVSR
jgi:DtxR family transcriptional regulator, Mn-dependent transcriptional regulator